MRKLMAVGWAMGMAVSAMAGNGGTTGEFLTLPVGARSAGMGEGGIAMARDASGLFLNPASMAGLKNAGVVGTHGAYIDSSYVDHISYVNPKGRWGAWGVGLEYFSAGSIDQTDVTGANVGSFTPNDLALTAGYARGTWVGRWGASVKYVRSKLVDSASTVSADLGIESKPLLGEKLKLSLAGRNLMGSLKFDRESNDLPMTIHGGAGYEVLRNWEVGVDAWLPKGEDSYVSLGTEYRLKVGGPWEVAMRGGYNTRTSDVDGFTGFGMGLGVTRKSLTVDYAFLPFGDVGSTHWITLGWRL